MGLEVRLENAKKVFDWQDLIDLLDDFIREAEQLERDKVAAENRALRYSDMIDYKNKEIGQLKAKIIALGGVLE